MTFNRDLLSQIKEDKKRKQFHAKQNRRFSGILIIPYSRVVYHEVGLWNFESNGLQFLVYHFVFKVKLTTCNFKCFSINVQKKKKHSIK